MEGILILIIDAIFTAPFATVQGTAVWIAISACWSAEVYVPDLCHKFWRLTLQVRSIPESCSTMHEERIDLEQI